MSADEPGEDEGSGAALAEPRAGSDPGGEGATRAGAADAGPAEAGAATLPAPEPPTRRRRRSTLPGVAVASPAPQPPSLRRRAANLLRRVEARAAGSPRRRFRFALYAIRLMLQVVRQWARDRCPQQAASLAFQTVLSIVPLLAVALAALRMTGLIGAESSLVAFLADRFVPSVSREEIAATLARWSAHVTFQSLGLIGLVSTVAISFVMWSSLEKVMNQIWRVERRRSLAQKFAVFYATSTIGPVLMGVSLYQAARFGLTEGWSGFFLSFVTSYAALFLANYFLPATPVRVRPALVGAAVTSILFELAKYGFNLYVADFAFKRYSGIYGALAVAPLWLVWIYWSWLMLLLGAEVAHAAQNMRLLERFDRRSGLSLENELVHRVNGPMAARVMVAIAEAYLSGAKVLSRKHIADRFDLSDDAIEKLAERLKRADLVMEVEGEQIGFTPARPPAEITLADVLAAFRAHDGSEPRSPDSAIDEVLAELERDTAARTRSITLADLVVR